MSIMYALKFEGQLSKSAVKDIVRSFAQRFDPSEAVARPAPLFNLPNMSSAGWTVMIEVVETDNPALEGEIFGFFDDDGLHKPSLESVLAYLDERVRTAKRNTGHVDVDAIVAHAVCTNMLEDGVTTEDAEDVDELIDALYNDREALIDYAHGLLCG